MGDVDGGFDGADWDQARFADLFVSDPSLAEQRAHRLVGRFLAEAELSPSRRTEARAPLTLEVSVTRGAPECSGSVLDVLRAFNASGTQGCSRTPVRCDALASLNATYNETGRSSPTDASTSPSLQHAGGGTLVFEPPANGQPNAPTQAERPIGRSAPPFYRRQGQRGRYDCYS